MQKKTLSELLGTDIEYKRTFSDKIGSNISNLFYSIRNFIIHKLYGYITKGFDLSDVWNLDITIVKYILKHINKNIKCIPLNSEELEFIINSLQSYIKDDTEIMTSEHQNTIYNNLQKTLNIIYTLLIDVSDTTYTVILPFVKKSAIYIVKRIEYLQEVSNGYPEYTHHKLYEMGLLEYECSTAEETWNKILTELTLLLKDYSKYSMEKALYILSKIFMNLWD